MECPDICGLTMEDASPVLSQAGIEVASVSVLKPPREASDDFDNSYRVIRYRLTDESKVEILVCRPL